MYDSLKPVVLTGGLHDSFFASFLFSCWDGELRLGARANILRAVANASVLVGYDKLKVILIGKKYGSGGSG
ncbi:hypothetical protein ACFX1Q_003212 [Malus domestica]